LGKPKGNETKVVAFLAPGAPEHIGKRIVSHCIKMRKNLKQFAKEIGISPKTIWNWQTGRRQPNPALPKRIVNFLSSQDLVTNSSGPISGVAEVRN
jgi:hypothetical protein